MTLLSDQQKAFDKLRQLKVGALFMEPGTGKTLTAFKLVESTDTDFVLFIIPFQTKDNLRAEMSKWHFNKPNIIVGIESISASDRIYLEILSEIKKHQRVFIVVDESLKIKNANAKRTQRVLKLGQYSEYRLVLNGTPLSKNVLDLWPQMEFLSPKILNMSLEEFKNTFAEYIKIKTTNAYGKKFWHEWIKGFTNIEYLYSLIDPFVFDAKLNLDVKTHRTIIYYDLANTLERYHELKNYYLDQERAQWNPNFFMQMTQAMQHAYTIEPQKFEILDQLLEKIPHPLIFCKFVDAKKALTKRYPQAKVLTYGKGALGLNLQAYREIVFFDKTFDYAQEEQAERRVYRTGQQEDVTYYDLTGNIGLDEMIDNNITRKMSMLDCFKQAAAKSKVNTILAKL